MTDRLDDAAEARIREACSRHGQSGAPESEGFEWDLATCTCPIQRAAILADREARSACPGCEAAIDDAAARLVAERAHADALAEALRELDAVARGPLHWGQRGVKIRAAKRAAKEVLAAHDARRK